MSKWSPGFRHPEFIPKAERREPGAEVLWADSICKN